MENTEQEDRKHNNADNDVQAIPFQVKPNGCQRHTSNRCGDEKNKPELNNRVRLEPHRGGQYSGKSSKIASLEMKGRIRGSISVMPQQEADPADQNDHGGSDYTAAQQIADDPLELFVY
jgi:hypothetical protein